MYLKGKRQNQGGTRRGEGSVCNSRATELVVTLPYTKCVI